MGDMVILALPEIVGGAGGTLIAGTLDYLEEQGKAITLKKLSIEKTTC